MKLTLCLCLLMASVFSYSQGKTAPNAKLGAVIVKGKIANINPPMQLWIYIGSEKWDTIPIKNGEFEYRKKTLLPAYGAIKLNYIPLQQSGSSFSNMSLMSVFFEVGTMIVTSPVDTLSTMGTLIKGSRLNDRFVTYLKKEKNILNAQKDLTVELSKATPDQLQSEAFLKAYENGIEKLNLQWDSLIKAELKRYPDSYHTIIAYSGYKRTREPDENTIRNVAAFMPELYRKQILESLDMKNKPREPLVQINKGDKAPDFAQTDPSGKLIKLADLKGKYTLIDFWASWSKPCRNANPDLVKLYEKYKKFDFEILGVSLDDKKEMWVEAIQQDGLHWVNISDLKGRRSDVIKQYGIEVIPQNYLLDKEGKVIAKSLKIEELDSLLDTLLMKSSLATMSDTIDEQKLVEVGDVVSLDLPDLYGRPVNFSTYNGKYVLLDFWASWCKPCRIENPYLIQLYEQYKGPNFDMISISIDTDRLAWYKAVKADGLPWLNLSDLKGPIGDASPYINSYNEDGKKSASVPQTYLIDPSGKVIAKNVRGKDLETLLKKTLSTQF